MNPSHELLGIHENIYGSEAKISQNISENNSLVQNSPKLQQIVAKQKMKAKLSEAAKNVIKTAFNDRNSIFIK